MFLRTLCMCLKSVGMMCYPLQPSQKLCDFYAGSILTGDTEITSRTEACRLNAKLAKILDKQTNQIESKCFLISQNISKKLITLSNVQRVSRRGVAGRCASHLKEVGHTQEVTPEVQILSVHTSVHLAGGQKLLAGLAWPLLLALSQLVPISLLNLRFSI